MPLEVVKTAKAGLASLANKWLFLAVGEEVTLEVVLSGEFCGAIGAAVLFRRRGARAPSIVAGVGQAEAATRVINPTSGHRIRKRFIAVLVDRILPRTRPVSVLRGRFVDGPWTRDG